MPATDDVVAGFLIHVPLDLTPHREVIALLGFEVVEPVDGVTLEAGLVGKTEARGARSAPVEAQRFQVTWHRDDACSERGGAVGGYVLADGTLELDPAR